MNDKVKLIQSEYDRTLSLHVNFMLYSFLNICTKSEPVVMLSIQIPMGGEDLNIEKVAQVSILNEKQYCIIPFTESCIPNIIQGVMMEHPELKTEVMYVGEERLLALDEVEDSDRDKYTKVVVCTVPNVDKERRDVMLDTVNLFYNHCKADMEKCKVEYGEKQMRILFGASAEEIDEARKALDKINDIYVKLRDDMNDKKIKEIEDAYQRYLKEQDADKQSEKEEIESDETDGGLSMKMFVGGNE